jgi:homospermidine synthase
MQGLRHDTFPAFNGRVVLVGFGALGNGVLPLLVRHFGLSPERLCIIDPRGDWTGVAAAHGIGVQTVSLTAQNHREILAAQLRPGDFLLNLSFDVSSLALIDLALERGAFYLDTCLEPWPGGHCDNAAPPSERTNYAFREKALARGKQNKAAATSIINCGANPWLVSQLLKQALLDMRAEICPDVAIPDSRYGWASLAKQLDIKVIQISERDNQQSSRRKRIGEFVNTWSVDAFVAEGLQPAELGWGTHERLFPADGARHEFGCGAAIYLNRPGLSTSVRTWTPRAGAFSGFLVTHGESISIADYLTIANGAGAAYRPTVYYAYHPSDDAVLSVHELAGRNWRLQGSRRVALHEITSGADELGVLLMGNARGAYWLGSFLSCDEASALAPQNNATTLQVNATVIAAMAWALRNPARGVIEPDDLDYKMILDIARPYLGEVKGAWTDWSPLADRNFPFAETQLETSDAWQFQNFRLG